MAKSRKENRRNFSRGEQAVIKKLSISIIYIYYNTPKEISDSINSINDAIGKLSYEVIIVNNNSPKELPRILKNRKHITIIKSGENLGFGAGVNKGAAISKGKYLLVVNPDTLFHKHAIATMVKALERDRKIGLLGPKYLDQKGSVSPSVSGMPFLPGALFSFSIIDKLFPNNYFSSTYWMRSFDTEKVQRVPAVGGACMLFRREAFEKILGFDKRFFMYFEEADVAYRIRKAGYQVVYYPKAVLTHFIARSSQSGKEIRQRYEQSRYRFFRKYHGLLPSILGEGLIRFLNLNTILLSCILGVSLFINLHKIQTLMMFYGDFARDLFVARDMLLTGNIPLLGIPSSVVWLHQGPLSIYLMSTALSIGKFNPVAPAILYALMGVGSAFLIYMLGKSLFSERVGLLSSAFYATSPVIVMNAREPYHTAPIPFFTLLFFLTLWKVLHGSKKLIVVLFILLGLLLQLELSNVVLIFVLGASWWFYKQPISRGVVIQAVIGLVLGLIPFILYDLMHKFIQIGGLFLWTINRIRLFFGLTTSGNATTPEVGNAVLTIWGEIVRVIYPLSPVLVVYIILTAIIIIFQSRKIALRRNRPAGISLIILWLIIPILGYTVHAKPGSAYFPVLYPAIIIMLAYTTWEIAKKFPVIFIFSIILITFNGYYLLINNYFLATLASSSVPSLYGYSYGISLEVQEDLVDFIVKDTKGGQFAIRGGGFLTDFATSVDNYKYLALWKGGRLSENAERTYIIYQQPKTMPRGHIVYKNQFLIVVRK